MYEFNLDYMTLKKIAIKSFNGIIYGCLFAYENNHGKIPIETNMF